MQADLLTFAANGVYGVTAITCVTAQNPSGIVRVESLETEFVIEQAEAVMQYFTVRAAKTGLLYSLETIKKVAAFFSRNPDIRLVIDPVMVSSSGSRIISTEAIDAYQTLLLPLASVITPNLNEAEILIGHRLRTPEDMDRAAEELAAEWNATIYLKGGHLGGNKLFDVVCDPEGALRSFSQKRIRTIDTHGSGCTLSACVTAHLAMGASPIRAIETARTYLRRGMEKPVFHSGNRFINHFPKTYS